MFTNTRHRQIITLDIHKRTFLWTTLPNVNESLLQFCRRAVVSAIENNYFFAHTFSKLPEKKKQDNWIVKRALN